MLAQCTHAFNPPGPVSVVLHPRCASCSHCVLLTPACSDLLQQYQQCSSREDILVVQKKWLEDGIYKGPKRDFPPTSSDSDSGGEGKGNSDSAVTKQMTGTKLSDSVLHV